MRGISFESPEFALRPHLNCLRCQFEKMRMSKVVLVRRKLFRMQNDCLIIYTMVQWPLSLRIGNVGIYRSRDFGGGEKYVAAELTKAKF
jgi:hypothetical protein